MSHDFFCQHPFVMRILELVSVHFCPITAPNRSTIMAFDMYCPMALQKNCANWHTYISQLWIGIFFLILKQFPIWNKKNLILICILWLLVRSNIFTGLLYFFLFWILNSCFWPVFNLKEIFTLRFSKYEISVFVDENDWVAVILYISTW